MRGVSRTLHVLRTLYDSNGERVATIARMTGIPRPTLYRILEALRSLGYVRRRSDGESMSSPFRSKR